MWLASGQPRTLGIIAQTISTVISLMCALLFLAIAFGWYMDPLLALHLFLGAILCLAFIHRTGNPLGTKNMTFAGELLALLSIACCGYLVFEQGRLSERLPVLDPLTDLDLVVSVVLLILVLEATRRCIGMTLVVLVSVFLMYGIWGDQIDGPFYHRALSLEEMADHLVFTTEGLFGPALDVAALLVFVFVIFGALFDRFGGGNFFHDIAQSLVGNQHGAPAKVSVISSALYGSVSGSPTADVVTTGSFTIPLMVRDGFSKVRASAIEAAASTGGSLLPPVMGSAAFLMSDFTGIAYSEIIIAAVFPAVFYFFCVYMSVNNHAMRHNLGASNKNQLPRFWHVLRKDWAYLVPLITIIWAVLALNRPAFAAALACLGMLPVIFTKSQYRRGLIINLIKGLAKGVERVILVGVACAAAGLVVGTLSMTDLTGKISSAMFALASGSYVLTIITAIVAIVILGMGMPVPAVYALSAVLAAPALIALGTDVLPAHLFIVYFCALSAITPPVAVAAFAAASISGSNPMVIAVTACRIGLIAFIIPLIFLIRPELLLQGSPTDIIATITSTLIGCWTLSGVTEGYLLGHLSKASRWLLAILTALIFFANSWISLAIGLCTLIFIYARRHQAQR